MSSFPLSSLPASPTRLGAHFTKAAAAWHPGLNVKLAVGGKAQFLGGHVQDSAAEEKGTAKVSRWRGRRRRREKKQAMEEKAAKKQENGS